MKLLTTHSRTERPRTAKPTRAASERFARHARSTMAPKTDDAAGRGMDLALTIVLFLVIGVLVDHWLGTSPVFTIILLTAASVGSFFGMKARYDAAMDVHQADLLNRRQSSVAPNTASNVSADPTNTAGGGNV